MYDLCICVSSLPYSSLLEDTVSTWAEGEINYLRVTELLCCLVDLGMLRGIEAPQPVLRCYAMPLGLKNDTMGL